jgi:hypothetical protein
MKLIAHRQHGVGRVLGELRAARVHHEQPVVIADERRVQRAHELDGFLVVAADMMRSGRVKSWTAEPSFRNRDC